MNGYINKSYLERGKTLAKLNAAIGEETAFTMKQDRKMFAHFVTWAMFMFVCVQI